MKNHSLAENKRPDPSVRPLTEYNNRIFKMLKARRAFDKQLAKRGIKINWILFPAGPQLLEAMNAGAIDIDHTGEAPPIFAQAASNPFVYIGNQRPDASGEAILVAANSPIKSVADLRGKNVALKKGCNDHYLLVRALENGRSEIF